MARPDSQIGLKSDIIAGSPEGLFRTGVHLASFVIATRQQWQTLQSLVERQLERRRTDS